MSKREREEAEAEIVRDVAQRLGQLVLGLQLANVSYECINPTEHTRPRRSRGDVQVTSPTAPFLPSASSSRFSSRGRSGIDRAGW